MNIEPAIEDNRLVQDSYDTLVPYPYGTILISRHCLQPP